MDPVDLVIGMFVIGAGIGAVIVLAVVGVVGEKRAALHRSRPLHNLDERRSHRGHHTL